MNPIKGLSFSQKMLALTDAKLLGLFRILFGGLMFYEMQYYLGIGMPKNGLTAPKMLFPYDGLDIFGLLSEQGFETFFLLMGFAALFIAAGFLYRFASIFFFFGYLYFFMLDRGYFNNHFYLFVLLSFMMMIIPANKSLSVDNLVFGKKNKEKWDGKAPYWSLFILRLQIFVVYFFGGIAKIHSDWLLHGEPVRSVFAPMLKGKFLETVATQEWFILFITWGGTIFDLAIGFFLWFKPTRMYAFAATLVFNITNAYVFDDIGVFPFFMLAANALFFEPWEVEAWFKRNFSSKKAKSKDDETVKYSPKKWIVPVFVVYFIVQFLLPLRFLVLPWDVDYTNIGSRFAWRMKLVSREVEQLEFEIIDPRQEKPMPVNVNTFINEYQIKMMRSDPRMAVMFAKWLKEEAIRRGVPDPQVRARIKISHSGRPAQYIFDPKTDLSQVEIDIWHPEKWILPKNEYAESKANS
jgi:hypothetical protein